MPTSLLTLYTENRKEFNRFAKFAVVGLIGAVIDISLLNVMHKVFDWPLLWANTLSVSVAILSNFTWNRLWTFPSRAPPQTPSTRPVHHSQCSWLGINNVIVVGLEAVFTHYIADPWDYNLAKFIAIGVVLFWNFGANRLWTYRGL